MYQQPTYDDLKQKIHQLEDENRRLKDALKSKSTTVNNKGTEKIEFSTDKSKVKFSTYSTDWQLT